MYIDHTERETSKHDFFLSIVVKCVCFERVKTTCHAKQSVLSVKKSCKKESRSELVVYHCK